ncbi:MAG TPA: hypothetical protein VM677_06775 [Actinokineospora sp.]|jgi:hypothetical protein|nr:hypothetical protein [Actinokineospora sp.]
MSDTTEDLIKAAFQRLADQAPDVRGIEADLRAAEAPARGQWVRWGGLAVAAAAAVTAITVPSVLTGRGPSDTPAASGTAAEPNPATVRPATPVREPGLAIPYRPEWLPDGFVEVGRSGGGAQSPWARSWTVNPAQSPSPGAPTLGFRHSPLPPDTEQGEVIDVNGVQGRLIERATSSGPNRYAEVTWTQSGELVVMSLSGVNDAKAAVLRIARSVKPDPVAAVPTEVLSFGWLPEGMVSDLTQVTGDRPDNYTLLRTATLVGDEGITAMLSPDAPAWSDGPTIKRTEVPVTVRGLPGTSFSVSGAPPSASGVVVRLSDRRWLYVFGGPDKDIIRVTNELRIAPLAPMAWIGKR